MPSTIYSYEPDRVSVAVGGNIISGFAEGTFISVSFAQDAISYNSGLADGSAVINPSREGDISITLIQEAESNGVLQTYITRARERNGVWYFPVLITNNSGGEIASCDAGWIVKEPNLDLAKTSQNRAWSIKTGNLILNHSNSYEIIDA